LRPPRSEDVNPAAKTRNARLKKLTTSHLPKSDVAHKDGPARLVWSLGYHLISERCYKRVFAIYTIL
jgi:hypothetical protein